MNRAGGETGSDAQWRAQDRCFSCHFSGLAQEKCISSSWDVQSWCSWWLSTLWLFGLQGTFHFMALTSFRILSMLEIR